MLKSAGTDIVPHWGTSTSQMIVATEIKPLWGKLIIQLLFQPPI
jgi:hypothetical protein